MVPLENYLVLSSILFALGVYGVLARRNAVLILSLRGHGELGSTFLNVLRRYVAALRVGRNTLLLIGVEPRLQEQLERTGLIADIGADNVFHVGSVSESTRAAVARAEQLVQPPALTTH